MLSRRKLVSMKNNQCIRNKYHRRRKETKLSCNMVNSTWTVRNISKSSKCSTRIIPEK